MFVRPTHRYLFAVMAGLTAAVLLAAGPGRAGDWDERYAQEAPRIAPYQDRVLRTGDDLHLQLLNGQEILLTNPPGYCQHPEACPPVYSFDGFIDAAGAYLVEVSYWEGGAFMLVDARAGARTVIVDRPHLDVSGRRFVAVLDSEEQGHAIEIWRLDTAGPQREFAVEVDGFLPLRRVARFRRHRTQRSLPGGPRRHRDPPRTQPDRLAYLRTTHPPARNRRRRRFLQARTSNVREGR